VQYLDRIDKNERYAPSSKVHISEVIRATTVSSKQVGIISEALQCVVGIMNLPVGVVASVICSLFLFC